MRTTAPTTGLVRNALILFIIALLFLRLWYVPHLRIDQDEWQHLHTIWSIGTGQMMYRDVFDNHMPFFHWLCAPIMQWIGERSDIIVVMRLTMIPLFATALALVYAIARSLAADKTSALWAAIVTGLFPVFLFTGTEFRPDQFWTVLWLATILVLVRGKIGGWRAFAAGLLLGFAFAVSMKTVLMLVSLVGGLLVTLLVTKEKPNSRAALRFTLALLGGLVIAPMGVVLWFAAHGALSSFWSCVFQHNISYAHADSDLRYFRMLLFPIGLAITLWRAKAILRFAPSPEIAGRRVFVFASGALYLTCLLAFWTVLNNETYLPVIAILMPAIALSFQLRVSRALPAVAIAAIELCFVAISRPPLKPINTGSSEIIAEVLRLTSPDEFVMDESGECIFRRRPWFPVMETLTRSALQRGEIQDTIAQEIVRTRTTVVVPSSGYPPATRKFLEENFLPFGSLSVAGKCLQRDSETSHSIHFNIAVASVYSFIARHGNFNGMLDGTRYNGPRMLAAGPHEIVPDDNTRIILAVWDRVLKHGFTYELGASTYNPPSQTAQIKPDYFGPGTLRHLQSSLLSNAQLSK